MTSLHVLFVDDEQAILDGLRNSLRKERKRWDMTFALGGQQALEEMKKTPADVVITDMRMPGMDGAELLRHIQRDFPAAARIVLSGQAERESIMRALPRENALRQAGASGHPSHPHTSRVMEIPGRGHGAAPMAEQPPGKTAGD